ncbi:MAG: AIR synthase family protein [Candidatus Micrarchaeota archaeon]
MEMPSLGKVSREIFDSIILPNLGANSKELVVPPQHGVDCGVIKFGNKYLIIESDPVYVAKELGMKKAAWFAIHILASDVAVMGAKPKYLSIDLNLPVETTVPEFREMWKTMSSECKKLGISIVAGHTAKYPGCHFPMVGGATMIGVADKYITPGMAKPGDCIIVTKGAAIEATGLLASFFYDKVKARIGAKIANKARALTWKMSVVEDALTAFKTGGVHAMHDATECGVYGALFEIAKASGVGMEIEREKIIVLPEAKAICGLFKIDPYVSISEGTLVISAKKSMAGAIVLALKRKGIVSSIVGVVTKRKEILLKEGKKLRKLSHPRIDPFWEACSGKSLEG